MSADFPGEPKQETGESTVDHVLRLSAYDDGRFGKPYGTTMGEFVRVGLDASSASVDTASLQRRVDAYKIGARDRHARQVAVAKKAGIAGGLVAVALGAIVVLRRAR